MNKEQTIGRKYQYALLGFTPGGWSVCWKQCWSKQ